MAVQTRMTAAEFLALPETNLPMALIDGEVIMSPSPTGPHQFLLFDVAKLIDRLIPNGRVVIAPMDVHLDELNVVQPDIMWIAEGSNCILVEMKHFRGAPDLVVEVLSPGTARLDRKDKFHLYEKFGVREYWMVDPAEKLLEVWNRAEGRFSRLDVFGPDEKFTSPLLGVVETKAVFPE